jgi:hypothetical protein
MANLINAGGVFLGLGINISFPKRSNPKSRIGPLQAGQTMTA